MTGVNWRKEQALPRRERVSVVISVYAHTHYMNWSFNQMFRTDMQILVWH